MNKALQAIRTLLSIWDHLDDEGKLKAANALVAELKKWGFEKPQDKGPSDGSESL